MKFKNAIKFGLIPISILLMFLVTAVALDQKGSADAQVIFQVA